MHWTFQQDALIALHPGSCVFRKQTHFPLKCNFCRILSGRLLNRTEIRPIGLNKIDRTSFSFAVELLLVAQKACALLCSQSPSVGSGSVLPGLAHREVAGSEVAPRAGKGQLRLHSVVSSAPGVLGG